MICTHWFVFDFLNALLWPAFTASSLGRLWSTVGRMDRMVSKLGVPNFPVSNQFCCLFLAPSSSIIRWRGKWVARDVNFFIYQVTSLRKSTSLWELVERSVMSWCQQLSQPTDKHWKCSGCVSWSIIFHLSIWCLQTNKDGCASTSLTSLHLSWR